MLGLLLSAAIAAEPASTSWVYIDPDTGACAKNHPPLQRIEVAQQKFQRRDDIGALEEQTKTAAVEALLRLVAAGRTQEQEAALRRAIGVEAVIDHDRKLICAGAIVDQSIVGDPTNHQQHTRAVARLADQIAAALGDDTVIGAVMVRWSTGCSAAVAGEHLAAAVRARLVQRGLRVTKGAGAPIRLELAAGPGDVHVSGWTVQGNTATQVGSATLSRGWLGLHADEGAGCRGTGALGIKEGSRAGADGRTVDVTLDTFGPLCNGERTSATLRPSEPSRVQVWSVGIGGEAWMTWDSAALPELRGGALDRRATLDLEAAHVPRLGEEMLLVIAAPPGSTMPSGQPGCQRGSLTQSDVPTDAALMTVPFSVLPTGRGECSAVAAPSVSWADYQAAAACQP